MVFVLTWSFLITFLIKYFSSSLRVLSLVILFSTPVGVLRVRSSYIHISSYICTMRLQSCCQRQSIIIHRWRWYYYITFASALHTLSEDDVCVAISMSRTEVASLCSISARFIWAPPAHEGTEDQARSHGELLGSVDASPPRCFWLVKNNKYARGPICQSRKCKVSAH